MVGPTRTLRVTATAVVALLLVTACGDDGSEVTDGTGSDDAASALRVGSFDFPESVVLAELYTQALGAAGVPVRLLESVGPREIVAPALEQGQIDVVPEYLGTAVGYFASGEAPPAAPTVSDLRDRLEPRGLTALGVAPAENTNVFVVLAERDLGPRISDLADVAPTLRFGALAECQERALCLLGLESRYGLTFAEFVPQPSLAFTAEALRRREIDVGLMFSTDAEISADLVVLEDDKALQPAENLVPVIRSDALDRWGRDTVTATLDAVSEQLTTEELRALNQQVADRVDTTTVATEWLTEQGLLGAD